MNKKVLFLLPILCLSSCSKDYYKCFDINHDYNFAVFKDIKFKFTDYNKTPRYAFMNYLFDSVSYGKDEDMFAYNFDYKGKEILFGVNADHDFSKKKMEILALLRLI